MTATLRLVHSAPILARAINRVPVVPYRHGLVDQVIDLAREMHAESELHRHLPFDAAKIVTHAEATLKLKHVFLALAMHGERAIGLFYGLVSAPYFSQEETAKDLAWFVSKPHRTTSAAFALLAAFEQWARDRGVRVITIGQSTGVHTERTRKLYEKLGYTVCGFNTMKRI